MKKHAWIILLLTSAVLMGALSKRTITGQGDIVTTTRNINAFTHLELNGVYNLILIQGDKENVRIETFENLQDFILVENTGNKLKIDMEDDISFKNSDKVKIYVTIKSLESLKCNIVGKITCENMLTSDLLKVEINGVGKTVLKVECNQFNANISSVGEFTILGRSKSANINHSGVGSYSGFDFKTDYLSATHSGVGSVEVYADKELDVTCSGIGNLYYKGNASSKSIKASGLGKVKRK